MRWNRFLPWNVWLPKNALGTKLLRAIARHAALLRYWSPDGGKDHRDWRGFDSIRLGLKMIYWHSAASTAPNRKGESYIQDRRWHNRQGNWLWAINSFFDEDSKRIQTQWPINKRTQLYRRASNRFVLSTTVISGGPAERHVPPQGWILETYSVLALRPYIKHFLPLYRHPIHNVCSSHIWRGPCLNEVCKISYEKGATGCQWACGHVKNTNVKNSP